MQYLVDSDWAIDYLQRRRRAARLLDALLVSGTLVDSGVLKVAHHGSSNGITRAILREVSLAAAYSGILILQSYYESSQNRITAECDKLGRDVPLVIGESFIRTADREFPYSHPRACIMYNKVCDWDC